MLDAIKKIKSIDIRLHRFCGNAKREVFDSPNSFSHLNCQNISFYFLTFARLNCHLHLLMFITFIVFRMILYYGLRLACKNVRMIYFSYYCYKLTKQAPLLEECIT